MKIQRLDLIAPSPDQILQELVSENFTQVIMLLILLLLVATVLVNIFVIKKNGSKKPGQEEQHDEGENV